MAVNSELTRDDLQELLDAFREIKHAVNNSMAVVMALAELSQRNPQHFEKLAQMVLARGPEVVSSLQDFQKRLAEKLAAAPTAE